VSRVRRYTVEPLSVLTAAERDYLRVRWWLFGVACGALVMLGLMAFAQLVTAGRG
jgi:hypothetical protein